MIEVFKKGFRLDIDPNQLVTFKKSQNLNGIQARYAYSNTVSIDKTANNKKLLELFDLPTNKVSSLMNGYEVDVVLNGSIQLRNQIMKLNKESLTKVDIYFLWSDNSLITKLKETFVNSIASGFLYKKTIADFNLLKDGTKFRTAFVETQPKSGLFVMEEMPGLIQLQELLKLIFKASHYGVYGDFFGTAGTFKDYWVAPNQGVYQIYSGIGAGFAPTFDPELDGYTFLNQVLQFFNCYATVDDTYKTVVINSWANLGNYKNDYVDYSRFFDNYQDYSFQSKLAKRNDMTYSDSGTTFNSYFPNNLSSDIKATYLNASFGAGSLNLFDDSTLDEDNAIEVRPNGEKGEISAMRIFKISPANSTISVFSNGTNAVGITRKTITAKKAIPVSMADVYTEFHKDYIAFIITPLVSNISFFYDDIMAADFSMTKVFFIEQLSSYWLPLEIIFATSKDKVIVKAMLVKKRKVPAPTLNNFNSVLLDFKETSIFPLDYLKGMYLMPPNVYPWDVVIFKKYDQNKNKLYINDAFIPAASLPQSFDLADIVTMKIGANKDSDSEPDKNTDSMYIQAIDTNGGVSNEAYITIKHTGVAKLESNFIQNVPYSYARAGFDRGTVYVNLANWYQGPRPNLNNTISSAVATSNESGADDTFNLVVADEDYTNVKIDVKPFNLHMRTDNNGLGKARGICRIITTGDGLPKRTLQEVSVTGDNTQDFVLGGSYTIPNFNYGNKIRVYMELDFDNLKAGDLGSMDVDLVISNFAVDITTTKTI